jgi:hypothetical protein
MNYCFASYRLVFHTETHLTDSAMNVEGTPTRLRSKKSGKGQASNGDYYSRPKRAAALKVGSYAEYGD